MIDNKKDRMKLYVQMFGHFHIAGNDNELSEDIIRSEMLTKLMVYFFCHHKSNLSMQEMTEVLWPDESSDNPAGALKNLMYRLRGLMKKQWPNQNFIETGRSSYRWSEEVEMVIDVEEFEKYIKQANQEKEQDKKIIAYEKAIDLYKGMFVPKLTGEYWIASLSTYYHSMYLNCIKRLMALLEENSRYDEMTKICSDAISIDALDEAIHCYFVKALIGKNETKLAMEQYQKASNVLYENLGIRPSKELREVYEELLKQNNEQEMSIQTIQKELREDNLKEDQGAFLCEYGVFKKTYHLEVRRAQRLGMSVYLSLLTIVPSTELKKDSPEYLALINRGMNNLQKVLLGSLRLGDVISKYSGTQFIVLLPTCQYETAKGVAERIEKSFYNTDRKIKVRLQYSLDEMSL